MIHLFLDDKPWFRPKSVGYGAGLPIAWQGWVLMIAHLALTIGLSFALIRHPALLMPVVLLVGLAPLPLYRARTAGGWRWRSGRPD